MTTQAWITLHHEACHELLLNVKHIESIAEYESHCVITMISGKSWDISDYGVDELSGLFDEIVTT
jgi:uncharacterized protein YlzI (FlbEa/FlbD family)